MLSPATSPESCQEKCVIKSRIIHMNIYRFWIKKKKRKTYELWPFHKAQNQIESTNIINNTLCSHIALQTLKIR